MGSSKNRWARSLNVDRPGLLRGLEAGAYGLGVGFAALYSHANRDAAPYAIVYAAFAVLVGAIKGWESRSRLREEERPQ